MWGLGECKLKIGIKHCIMTERVTQNKGIYIVRVAS